MKCPNCNEAFNSYFHYDFDDEMIICENCGEESEVSVLLENNDCTPIKNFIPQPTYNDISNSSTFNIYVLKCVDNKYYVGKTKLDIKTRFQQHLTDKTCSFTSKYKPIEIIDSIQSNDSLDEDKITKKYMMKFGIENVRGGSYTKLELEDWQIKSLKHEFTSAQDMCYKCNKSGHFAKDCPNDITVYLNKFTNINDIDQEINRVQNIYDKIVILTNQINDTNDFLPNIENIKKYKSTKDRDELQQLLQTTRSRNESEDLYKKYQNIHNMIGKINSILTKTSYLEIPKYKTLSNSDEDYDMLALRLINFNLNKKNEIKNMLVKYKYKDNIEIKNILCELYDKRIKLLTN